MTRPAGRVVNVAAAVIERPDGSFLLGQRAADTFYPGYWEFPGGKVEPGETAHAALIRELDEELGLCVERADPWLRREHVYEHAHVNLNFFRVREWQGELRDHVHAALAWQSPGRTSVAPMLPANAPVLAALALPDVYAITHAGTIGITEQLRRLEWALAYGLELVQLREPALDTASRSAFAEATARSCRKYGARLLINGDAALARACGADGVHLTAAQLAGAERRPDFALVGASCHSANELQRAAALGCDFAVLGPVKETATHPDRPGMGWDSFAKTLDFAPLPTYALGGLSRGDIDAARRAGAHGIAAIRAAWPNQRG